MVYLHWLVPFPKKISCGFFWLCYTCVSTTLFEIFWEVFDFTNKTIFSTTKHSTSHALICHTECREIERTRQRKTERESERGETKNKWAPHCLSLSVFVFPFCYTQYWQWHNETDNTYLHSENNRATIQIKRSIPKGRIIFCYSFSSSLSLCVCPSLSASWKFR